MAPSRAGDANFYSRIRSFWFKSPCVLSPRLFPTLSLVPSLSPSQLPDFVPLARSASVKLLAASEIHTNSIHFKCTCRQLPKKKRRKVCVKGELFYTLAKRARWRWRKEMEMTALAPAVVVAVLHREKHCLLKKRKQVESWKVISFYLNLLQIFLNYFN